MALSIRREMHISLEGSYPVDIEDAGLINATSTVAAGLRMLVNVYGRLGLGRRSKEKECGSTEEVHVVKIGRLNQAKDEQQKETKSTMRCGANRRSVRLISHLQAQRQGSCGFLSVSKSQCLHLTAMAPPVPSDE
jgi:hypothetical protein